MDIKDLKDLIKFLDKSGFTEFEYESDDFRIFLSKQVNVAAPQVMQPTFMQPATQTLPQQSAQATENIATAPKTEDVASNPNHIEIKSPIVGTFYEAPAPGAEPFVREGEIVKKGKTLCIIEAMKIMNEIEAEFDCKIVKKVGVNAEPVEYGETIFIVEKV
ncbi:MAG: biotin carboxyl carrier protein [Deferribacteraceae bacterium]|jgi:acetyl-CoA carboxylase biotin carboxyl carrier protein|nr:biotin carboxyl carrier protein [Deferribacteraceae bacterium]